MANSFSSTVREELAHLVPERECCRRAELAGLVQMTGRYRAGSGRRPGLLLRCGTSAVARKAFRYWKELFALLPEVAPVQKRAAAHARHYALFLPAGMPLNRALGQLGLRVAQDGRPFWRTGRPPRSCCARSYLRGLFLGGGSVNSPDRTYHLELLVRNESQEKLVLRLMGNLKLAPHSGLRHGQRLVYLKESDQIGDFMKVIGAYGALLQFENARIVKEMRNGVNRLVNAETANVQKTVNAAVRQVQNIAFLQAVVGLDNLPPTLAQVARLRLELPDASLRELGEMAHPPLTKSGVNHRLRRLEEMAEDTRAAAARREEERAQGRTLSGPGA